MKHPYEHGFHTTTPYRGKAPQVVLVERRKRSRKPTGLVIPCTDAATAEKMESDLFFVNPNPDCFYQAVPHRLLDKVAR